jgi:hypothetical protein
MGKKKTTEQFIQEAKQIHGDKYDYSLVKYKDAHSKVEIICNKCDEIFWQRACSHIALKQDCPNCAKNNSADKRRKTVEQFIQEAKSIHGDKYNYSLVEYKGNHTKIVIICNICNNQFEQEPNSHTSQKAGCSLCAGIVKKTTEQFIKEAQAIHNCKYDYSLVDYINSKKDVKILCKRCNQIFSQKPSTHLIGHGCNNCNLKEGSLARAKTTEQFIQEAQLIHGNLYDYSLVEYKTTHDKVLIKCNIFIKIYSKL